MPDGFDIDHTSFGVRDALAAARWARHKLGATPVFGEALADFRYVLLHVGDERGGGRIEFIEPVDHAGFLSRFLAKHGEHPHHLTWTVPDVADVVARLRAAGFTVVNEDFEHPPWREAFVLPDPIHRVVIQVAATTRAFPTPAELLGTRERDPQAFPSNRGATAPDWWTPVWDTEPDGFAHVLSTTLVSTDLAASDRLFGEILHGELVHATATTREYGWERSLLHVRAGNRAGVVALTVAGDIPGDLMIADIPILRKDHRPT
jgi:catechol 2,3-dioxygenase-like lactoylglutathione lyase family enzyme